MRVIACNQETTSRDIVKWGRFQVWNLLQCPWGAIKIGISRNGTESKISFEAPGAGAPEHKERLLAIYRGMKAHAQERFAGLDTRRLK